MTNPMTYILQVHQLNERYVNQDSLGHSTRLQTYESRNPFVAFHAGETISDGASMTYLGRIAHIHHNVGETSDGEIIHTVSLYLHPEDGKAE